MKQAGLIKKPMYVVPNHLLEQFCRVSMQLYPDARLLIAAKEDFAATAASSGLPKSPAASGTASS